MDKTKEIEEHHANIVPMCEQVGCLTSPQENKDAEEELCKEIAEIERVHQEQVLLKEIAEIEGVHQKQAQERNEMKEFYQSLPEFKTHNSFENNGMEEK